MMRIAVVLLMSILSVAATVRAQEGQSAVAATDPEQDQEGACPFLTFSDSRPDFAFSVAGGGDVNGDGTPDFAVGTPGFEHGGPYTGRVEVFSGKDGSTLHTFVGASQKSLLGFAVCIPGDLNGDGKADIAAGAPLAGRVFLWSGADGSLLRTVEPADEFGGSWFGASIAALGDLDTDGLTDLAIGAPRHKILLANMGGSLPPQYFIAGRAHVVSGRTGKTIHTLGTDPAHLNDSDPLARFYAPSFGRSVRATGDLDGDGTPDLAVGAPGEPMLWFYGRSYGYISTLPRWADRFHRPHQLHWELTFEYEEWCRRSRGGAYAFSGRDGSPLLALEGAGTPDGFGCDMAGLGDVDGDGKADLAVGAYREATEGGNQGAVRIHSGAGGKALAWVRSDARDSELGFALVAAGDVDGDGLGDLWVGDPVRSRRVQDGYGEVLLLSGRDGSLLRSVGPWPRREMEDIGFALATLDDVDGDGLRDLLITGVGFPDASRVGIFSAHSGERLLEISLEPVDAAGKTAPGRTR